MRPRRGGGGGAGREPAAVKAAGRGRGQQVHGGQGGEVDRLQRLTKLKVINVTVHTTWI